MHPCLHFLGGGLHKTLRILTLLSPNQSGKPGHFWPSNIHSYFTFSLGLHGTSWVSIPQCFELSKPFRIHFLRSHFIVCARARIPTHNLTKVAAKVPKGTWINGPSGEVDFTLTKYLQGKLTVLWCWFLRGRSLSGYFQVMKSQLLKNWLLNPAPQLFQQYLIMIFNFYGKNIVGNMAWEKWKITLSIMFPSLRMNILCGLGM